MAGTSVIDTAQAIKDSMPCHASHQGLDPRTWNPGTPYFYAMLPVVVPQASSVSSVYVLDSRVDNSEASFALLFPDRRW